MFPYQELVTVGGVLNTGHVGVLSTLLVLVQLLLGVEGQDTLGLQAGERLEEPLLTSPVCRGHRCVIGRHCRAKNYKTQ